MHVVALEMAPHSWCVIFSKSALLFASAFMSASDSCISIECWSVLAIDDSSGDLPLVDEAVDVVSVASADSHC